MADWCHAWFVLPFIAVHIRERACRSCKFCHVRSLPGVDTFISKVLWAMSVVACSAAAYTSTPAVAFPMLPCLAIAEYICVVAPQCWHCRCVGMACTCIAFILRSCSHVCKWFDAIRCAYVKYLMLYGVQIGRCFGMGQCRRGMQGGWVLHLCVWSSCGNRQSVNSALLLLFVTCRGVFHVAQDIASASSTQQVQQWMDLTVLNNLQFPLVDTIAGQLVVYVLSAS